MLFPIGDDNISRGHFPLFSYGFIVLNLAVYLFQHSLPSGTYAAFIYEFGAIPNEIVRGVDLQTLFTSIFLHGSWAHLLGNMLFLWIFADNIEAVVGSVRFLLFYLAAGLVAGLTQVFFDPFSGVPCVGASGAIAGVMGAYIVMFPRSRIRMIFLLFFAVFYVPAWVFLGLWFGQQLSSGLGVLGQDGFDAGGVAWWAHIGGFVFGAVMGIYLRKRFVSTSAARVTD